MEFADTSKTSLKGWRVGCRALMGGDSRVEEYVESVCLRPNQISQLIKGKQCLKKKNRNTKYLSSDEKDMKRQCPYSDCTNILQ